MKKSLGKISLIAILTIMFTITSYSNNLKTDFSGSWCWEKDSKYSTFSIEIKKSTRGYKGGYSCVISEGDRIEDSDFAFSFDTPNGNIVKTKLKAGINGTIGLVQIKILNNNKMEWLILKTPEGEFNPPNSAILKKCRG